MCLHTQYGIHPYFNYILTLAGAWVIFNSNFCTIFHPDKSVITKVTRTDGLYHMSANVVETINEDQYTLYVNGTWRPLLYELHCHLSHIHYEAIRDEIWDGLSKSTLIMLISNSVRCVQLEDLQHSHSQRSCPPMQTILERVSIGTYRDLQV